MARRKRKPKWRLQPEGWLHTRCRLSLSLSKHRGAQKEFHPFVPELDGTKTCRKPHVWWFFTMVSGQDFPFKLIRWQKRLPYADLGGARPAKTSRQRLQALGWAEHLPGGGMWLKLEHSVYIYTRYIYIYLYNILYMHIHIYAQLLGFALIEDLR